MRLTRPGTRWLTRGALFAALGLAALFVVAACGSSGGSGASGGATSSGSAATSGAGAGTQVTATLTEVHIALSRSTFTPGTYTFVATNSGSSTHALEITGPGLSAPHTANLSPGQTANLTVTLQNGSYDLFCPVDGHKELGMDMPLTVGGSGVATSAPTSAPTATSGVGGGGVGGY